MDMSLVKGLEEKQARDKETYLGKLAAFLRSAGIDATFDHEKVLNFYDSIMEDEPVVKIAGQNITRILLRTRILNSCGLWQSISFFDYETPVRNGRPTGLTGKVKVRVRPVKQGRILGIFGGKVAAVHWTGGMLAQILSDDRDLSETLLSTSVNHGYPDIMIQFRDDSLAEISGPQFDAPPHFLRDVLSYPVLPPQEDDLFHVFELYNRIAGHLNDIANTGV